MARLPDPEDAICSNKLCGYQGKHVFYDYERCKKKECPKCGFKTLQQKWLKMPDFLRRTSPTELGE